LVTISGGGASEEDVFWPGVADVGMWIGWSIGWRSKSASTACDCAARGVVASLTRLTGRRERGSAVVGTDSGIGSDMAGRKRKEIVVV